jgi:hypothetical protein
MARIIVATPAAKSVPSFDMAGISAPNVAGRGMSATVSSMATAIATVTTAMSSTRVHRRRYCQKSRHHKRSTC